MVVLTYKIELLEPVLITGLKGDPNSAVGLDYIPGSAIRGAIISSYAKDRNKRIDPTDSQQRKLFFDGQTRFLNAYPEDGQEARSLPTPLSWRRDKAEDPPKKLRDFFFGEGDKEITWVRVGAPYCSVRDASDASVELVSPKRWLAVHTYRSRRYGRPVQEGVAVLEEGEVPGFLFRYESLAAGQAFRGVVLCPDDAAAQEIEKLLPGIHHLGAARTAGYGKVKISDVRGGGQDWSETGQGKTKATNGEVRITLLSDAIVRNERGQLMPDAETLAAAIQQVAGGSWKPDPGRCYFAVTLVGGFNRKWGLPLPQAWAIAKGSVFVFEVQGNPNLAKLVQEGVGERRLDGFGRVAVNWPDVDPITVVRPEKGDSSSTPGLEGEAKDLAERMLERIGRRRLEAQVTALGLRAKWQGTPTPSQLSRLRLAIRRELSKENPNLGELEETVEKARQRNTSRRQFERARVDGIPFFDWVKHISGVTKDKRTFEEKFVQPSGSGGFELPELPGFEAGDLLDDETLRTEYVLRYLDAVLLKAVKSKREKEGI